MSKIRLAISVFGIIFFVAVSFLLLDNQGRLHQEKLRIQQVADEFCNGRGFNVAKAYGKEQHNLRAINCYTTKEICLEEICSKVIEKEQYFTPTDWQEKDNEGI